MFSEGAPKHTTETSKDAEKNVTIFNKYFSSVFNVFNLENDQKTLAEFGKIRRAIKEKLKDNHFLLM